MLLTITVLGFAGFGISLKLFAGTCLANDELTSAEREAIDRSSLEFARTLVSPKFDGAYATLSPEMQSAFPPDKFAELAHRISQLTLQPPHGLRVIQTYLVKMATGGRDQHAVCGSLGRPEDWVAVATKEVPEQAYTLIQGETINNTWTFVLWLIPKHGWRIQSFHVSMTGMVGKGAADLWSLARTEKQRNHNFNGAILFAAAKSLADRGPDFQLGILPAIDKDIAHLKPPAELQGRGPWNWNFGGESFKGVTVGALGVDGKIYLTINHVMAPWGGDGAADARNQILIKDFIEAFPEYSDAFSGLIVGAVEQDRHRGYRTVYVTPTHQK